MELDLDAVSHFRMARASSPLCRKVVLFDFASSSANEILLRLLKGNPCYAGGLRLRVLLFFGVAIECG